MTTLAALLASHRYVYATVGEDALGAYRADRERARRDAARMCRKLDVPVFFYEDGVLAGKLTPVATRAMWTAVGKEAA